MRVSFSINTYATGTRTDRGLEAITLSIPPTPGRSVIKRPDNGNMYTLMHQFKRRGYDTRFIYGGYGYFDNMNKFLQVMAPKLSTVPYLRGGKLPSPMPGEYVMETSTDARSRNVMVPSRKATRFFLLCLPPPITVPLHIHKRSTSSPGQVVTVPSDTPTKR